MARAISWLSLRSLLLSDDPLTFTGARFITQMTMEMLYMGNRSPNMSCAHFYIRFRARLPSLRPRSAL